MTKLLTSSIIVFLASFLLRVAVSNNTALKTHELNRVDLEIAQVKTDISELNQTIYLVSSVTGLETRANTIGFVPMTKPVNSVTNPTIARAL